MLRQSALPTQILSASSTSREHSSETHWRTEILRRAHTRFRVTDKRYRLIRLAFDIAAEAHRGATRLDGLPYISHPATAAIILTDEFGVRDHRLIALALLHDVPEDNREFWFVVSMLFSSFIGEGLAILTRPDTNEWDESLSLEYHSRFLAAPRGILAVKLADRLHNLRTIGYLPPRKQASVVWETERFYLPLARTHRIGAPLIELELDRIKERHARIL